MIITEQESICLHCINRLALGETQQFPEPGCTLCQGAGKVAFAGTQEARHERAAYAQAILERSAQERRCSSSCETISEASSSVSMPTGFPQTGHLPHSQP